MTTLRPIALWGPVLAAMGGLFALSSQSTLPGVQYAPDKLLHTAAYAVLGLLFLRAAHGGIQRPRVRPTVVSFGVCMAYAAIEEWHQATVPGRDASAGDWIADGVGLCLAWLVLRLVAVPGSHEPGRRAERP